MQHHIIEIRPIGGILFASALTDDRAVPDGHYGEKIMRITVFPNRKAIVLCAADLDSVFVGSNRAIHPLRPLIRQGRPCAAATSLSDLGNKRGV